MSPNEFKDLYEQADRTCVAVDRLINYLMKDEYRQADNRSPRVIDQLRRGEPDNLTRGKELSIVQPKSHLSQRLDFSITQWYNFWVSHKG